MKRRSGFTLVELMVAMALIMFLMAILSEAFVAGLKTFRDLKAVSDMAERLRSASTLLRRELAADHFDGKRRLSQPDFWQSEGPGLTSPPREGFFRVYQGTAPSATPTATGVGYFREGSDPSELATNNTAATVDLRLLNSYRATDQMLHFTVKLRGNERGDFYSAGNIPASGAALLNTAPFRGNLHYQEAAGSVYNAQWAEVVYFLRKLPDTAHGTPLFALCRRQLLLVPDNGLMNPAVIKGAAVPAGIKTAQYEYPEMSCRYALNPKTGKTEVYFNNPRDVTMPIHRFGMDPINLAGVLTATDPLTTAPNPIALSYPTMYEDTNSNVNYQGADVLLSDVISFEVRVLPVLSGTVGTRFVSLFDSSLTASLGFNRSLNGNIQPRVFDTWSNMVEKAGNDYSTWNPGAAPNPAADTPIPFNPNLRLSAIQVIIRVWDVKTEQTREMTVAQDL